ncbi:MAG: dienelactone hydrolase-related enzyme, partial [Pseudomonadota bacterium]
MYHRWLDRWDERRAERSDGVKPLSPFKLDTHLAFPGKAQAEDIAGFCKAADQALNDPLFFKRSTDSCDAVERDGSWLSFPSEIQTDVDPNNIVRARVTDGGTRERALVMFHHWNATSRQDVIANFFSKRGITVVEIAMPYHFERSRPGALHAEDMLSANLGRTVQSVRQAVLDGQQLICWLRNEGFGEISVLG